MNNAIRHITLENFKSFDNLTDLKLAQPSVIIGPNNSGKTTILQALALWNQGIKNWYQEKKHIKIKKSEGIGLNRLLITQVPVKEVKYFWNNVKTKQGKDNIEIKITVGLLFKEKEENCTLILRYYNAEVVYMYPSKETLAIEGLLEYAASLDVKILYPMSGITDKEFLLQKGAIDSYIGQGKTSEVLVNLCYKIYENSPKDWKRVCDLMNDLFDIQLQIPQFIEANGTVELKYNTPLIKWKASALDISLSGRGQQEMLLLISYLFSNKNGILLLDEPDAHLELLRQRQVFSLLKHLAEENGNQIIIATHSEVISNEADNLTLIVGNQVIDLKHNPTKQIEAFIGQFGIEHFYKSKLKKSVIYVEGSTDIDMLSAFADKLNHPCNAIFKATFYYFYTQDSEEKETHLDKELTRIGSDNYRQSSAIHWRHFNAMKNAVPELKGIAVFDSDGESRTNKKVESKDFEIIYWERYELENYFITPNTVFRFIKETVENARILGEYEDLWDKFVLKNLFDNRQAAYEGYMKSEDSLREYQFEQLLSKKKASLFLEQYFAFLSQQTKTPILLNKGSFYKLINYLGSENIDTEIGKTLDLIYQYLK